MFSFIEAWYLKRDSFDWVVSGIVAFNSFGLAVFLLHMWKQFYQDNFGRAACQDADETKLAEKDYEISKAEYEAAANAVDDLASKILKDRRIRRGRQRESPTQPFS